MDANGGCLLNLILFCFIARSSSFIFRPAVLLKAWKSGETFSTKINWEDIPVNRNISPDELLNSPRLQALIDTGSPEQIDVEPLIQQWIDVCIEKGRPEDLDLFSLSSVLPMVQKGDMLVEILNQTLSLNQEVDSTVSYVTEQELKQLWLERSNEAMSQPMDKFDIKDALLLIDDEDIPMIMPEMESAAIGLAESQLGIVDYNSEQVDATALLPLEVNESNQELVITEQELERIWDLRSEIAWGMPGTEFQIESALLLLDADEDDDEEEIMAFHVATGSGGHHLQGLENSMGVENGMKLSPNEFDFVEEQSNDDEEGVAEEEEEEEEELISEEIDESIVRQSTEIEYVHAYKDPVDILADTKSKMAFWNRFTGRSNQLLRETLRRMYQDLETTVEARPAWRKDRSFLSPDIETQRFMGDIMFSNTYMTQRIPANWDDPEQAEMSDTYLSTGSMAWPGQAETDYNFKLPIWEELKLPFGPQYSSPEQDGIIPFLLRDGVTDGVDLSVLADLGLISAADMIEYKQKEESSSISSSGSSDVSRTLSNESSETNEDDDSSDVDWANFDFADADTSLTSANANSPIATSEYMDPSSDAAVDQFFNNFQSQHGGSEDDVDDDGDMNYDELSDEENAARRRDILYKKAVQSSNFSNLVEKSWRTPEEWITREEFANHVGYDEWSNYDARAFEEADDLLWDDDIYMAQSIQHVKAVTDVYLNDHTEAVRTFDAQKYWNRQLQRVFLGEENCEKEPIPSYLTPDIDRGVEYSDEVIEMKGKKSLHPEIIAPKTAYENDTFTPNEEFDTLNKIGTIRDQYEWQPRSDLEHVIEEDKLEQIKPILEYINHAGVLQSTKDDILIFAYRGHMRHLIGIRSSMIALAKKCYPQCVDVRLETVKGADKFDV